MFGSPHAIRIALLAIMVFAIAGWLWRMRALSHNESSPRATDRYEGSSGMGADGFGGWPSKPDAPR